MTWRPSTGQSKVSQLFDSKKTCIHLVVAARPNFIKLAPLLHALRTCSNFRTTLVHTGQHYDAALSDEIMLDLRMDRPDHFLGVGSGSHAEQTGRVMIEYEKVLLNSCPSVIVVAGDVNSTFACAFVGVKMGVPVVHLEAGLRSRDRTMPEEINRLATDSISDILWTPSIDASQNLRSEGIDPERISMVGNIMMDSYELIRPAIHQARFYEILGVAERRYGVVTLHRPANVDSPTKLASIVDSLRRAATKLQLVFPVHPRTQQQLASIGADESLRRSGVIMTPPLSYKKFMSLVERAAVVITDSGGLQEETTYLGIPCLTMRDTTERPITISQGTNTLVSAHTLDVELERVLSAGTRTAQRPPLWDGATATRCVEDLSARLEKMAS